MKTEIKLLKASFIDVFLFTIFFLVIINLFAWLISMVLPFNYTETLHRSWLNIIVIPIIFGLIISLGNRKAELVLSGIDNVEDVLKKIEGLIVKKNFRIKSKVVNQICFERKTLFGRFFDFFAREAYTMKCSNDMFVISSKRGILQQLNWKIKKQILNEQK